MDEVTSPNIITDNVSYKVVDLYLDVYYNVLRNVSNLFLSNMLLVWMHLKYDNKHINARTKHTVHFS